MNATKNQLFHLQSIAWSIFNVARHEVDGMHIGYRHLANGYTSIETDRDSQIGTEIQLIRAAESYVASNELEKTGVRVSIAMETEYHLAYLVQCRDTGRTKQLRRNKVLAHSSWTKVVNVQVPLTTSNCEPAWIREQLPGDSRCAHTQSRYKRKHATMRNQLTTPYKQQCCTHLVKSPVSDEGFQLNYQFRPCLWENPTYRL